MSTTFIVRIIIFLSITLLLDLYIFRGLKSVTDQLIPVMKMGIRTSFWVISVVIPIAVMWTFYHYPSADRSDYTVAFTVFGILILFLVPKIILLAFQLFQDIFNLADRALFYSGEAPARTGEMFTRRTFLFSSGIVLATIPFGSTLYGLIKGRFQFTVKNIDIPIKDLPKELEGYTIAQISDLHLGSFFKNFNALKPAIKKINQLNADLFVFTGDLVNSYAEETEGWDSVFRDIRAKDGKYSVLGNHDYGSHGTFLSQEDKSSNFEKVVAAHKTMDFKLLRNENVVIERNGKKLALLGVENWGLPPFPQYGDLQKASMGAENADVKVLLSHDPSHFDEHVIHQGDVDLTLSGHTHGMQFGVELGSFKWSPVKYRYPKWAGLYKTGKQHLYVNRGIGYIGFPGRVGIWPEITKLTLVKA